MHNLKSKLWSVKIRLPEISKIHVHTSAYTEIYTFHFHFPCFEVIIQYRPLEIPRASILSTVGTRRFLIGLVERKKKGRERERYVYIDVDRERERERYIDREGEKKKEEANVLLSSINASIPVQLANRSFADWSIRGAVSNGNCNAISVTRKYWYT